MAAGDFITKRFNPRYIVTKDDNIIFVKLMAVDTEVTFGDIGVAVDAEGRLKSSGAITAHVDDLEDMLAGRYYKRGKPYTYVSGRIKYKTKNTDLEANETDTDWSIWKYTDAAIPEEEGPRTGAVDNEAAINALAWNI